MKPLLAGQIEERYEFESPCILQYDIRGHVEVAEFLAALEYEYSLRALPESVQHVYARNVPVGRDFPGEMVQCPAQPGRGAFPLTLVEHSVTWSEAEVIEEVA